MKNTVLLYYNSLKCLPYNASEAVQCACANERWRSLASNSRNENMFRKSQAAGTKFFKSGQSFASFMLMLGDQRLLRRSILLKESPQMVRAREKNKY